MKFIYTFYFLFISFIVIGQNNFSRDEELRKIYTYEYERLNDSLLPYLNSNNNTYRYMAIKSMASVQDTSTAPILSKILIDEKIDSFKLALIYSLSQLDCYFSFNTLMNYYSNCPISNIKYTCLAAIGKIAKKDLTDFYIHSFNNSIKSNTNYIANWLKGVYLAKRNKQIDLEKNKQQLIQILNSIVDSNLGKSNEVNYYYSKLVTKSKEVDAVDVKTIPKNKQEIDEQIKLIKSPYQKLNTLSKYNLTEQLCKEFIFSNEHALLKSYALDHLLSNHNEKIQIDAALIQSIFDLMDVALISRMCEYIIEQKKQNKNVAASIDMLQNTQRQLFLPRDFETWIDLEKAILSFEGKIYEYKSCFETGYKNPIDWKYIVKIAANQKVKITTNKGNMILLLHVNDAPGSVGNYLKLVDQGYYNGKYFHRMVPNFVVQGGCPRGDGWGSLEWNQRSELSGNPIYKKGSVGLASVGKDSEGVQFFISHTFAPHLEGRYTIFADVIDGLDVIENLMVGDQIISIERLIN